ncbi:leucine-rich repeat domain-containing protein [Psychrobacter sp. I-STPA10]|uniref:leucine-rich repeat domain-containing protein n=1 Tax=Psychrobacter sp. I-STPA10 TaxID=2585769 RepID=UPI001E364317|nr:leucine-rich repeat domain-containing protein [Psychrobacter sp. I-STPA10]
MTFRHSILYRSLAFAMTATLASVSLTGCGGSADERKESLYAPSHDHHHDHDHDGHEHDGHDHDHDHDGHEHDGHNHDHDGHDYGDAAGSVSANKRYPYKGNYPLSARALTPNRLLAFSKLTSNPALPVIMGMANQQPYYAVNITDESITNPIKPLDDWIADANVVDMVSLGLLVYVLDDKNRLSTFGSHGDHFHGHGNPSTLTTVATNSHLSLVTNPNQKLPYIFDSTQGQLLQVVQDKNFNSQAVATNIGGQQSILDFTPEHVTWVGAMVDETVKKETLAHHPDSGTQFDNLEQGRWVVAGKTNAGEQKLAVIKANRVGNAPLTKADIISSTTVDYPITALASSANHRYAVIVSDTDNDAKDKLTFLDSGLYLQSHGDHSDPVIAPPNWSPQTIKKPNPMPSSYRNSLEKYSTSSAIAFAGDNNTAAGFVVFDEHELGHSKAIDYHQLTDIKTAGKPTQTHIVVEPTGSQVLVAISGQLLGYEKKEGHYQQLKQTALTCSTPQSLLSHRNGTLLSCDDGLYDVQLGYDKAQLKTLAFKDAGIDNQSLLDSLQHAPSTVEFDYNNPSPANVQKYLAGVTTLTLYDDSNPLQLNGLQYFTGVKELYLDYAPVPDTSLIVSKFPNLETLSVAGTGIRNYDFLAQLPKLTNINLSDNFIDHAKENAATDDTATKPEQPATDLSFLSRYPNLTHVAADANNVKDMHFVKSLPKLKVLNLNYNSISDASALSSLNHLTELGLMENKLTTLPTLSQNAELTTVYLTGNKLTNLSAFANLPKLELIKADYNQINSLATLVQVPMLKTLELASNQLTDNSKADIDRLAQANTHTTITIYGNPVAKTYGKDVIGGKS